MQILLLSATDSTAAAESLNLLEDVADMAAQGAGVAEDIEKLNPNYIVQSLQEALPLLLKLLYQIGIVLLILLVGSKLISYFMGLFGKFLEKKSYGQGAAQVYDFSCTGSRLCPAAADCGTAHRH